MADGRPTTSLAYRRFLTASAVSLLGDGFRYAALPLLAVELGAGPGGLGLLLAVATLPFLVIGLVGGVVVDRMARRSVLLFADAARALILAGLAGLVLAGAASMPVLFVVAFLMGAFESVGMSASFAFVPEIVDRAALPMANAGLSSAALMGRDMVGPLLGAVALQLWLAGPFAVDAVSFLISFLLIATIPRPVRAVLPSARRGVRSITGDIQEAWRWMRLIPPLVTVAVVAGAVNLVNMGALALQAHYAQEVLGHPPAAYGVLMFATAVGGIAGSWCAPGLLRSTRWSSSVVVALLFIGAGFLIVATAPGLAVACVGRFTSGLGFATWAVTTVSLRQRLTPAHLMGRADSLHRFISWGVLPLGSALGGITSMLLGPRAPFWLAGVVPLALAVVVHLRRSAFEDQSDQSRRPSVAAAG